MRFLGQIDLEETDISLIHNRRQLLLIFLCTNYPLNAGTCDEWDPDLGGNAAKLVPKTDLVKLSAPCSDEEFILDETKIRLENCDDSPEHYFKVSYESQFDGYGVCGKLGGEPSWTQDDQTPICTCGTNMTFVAQIDWIGDFEIFSLGYVFVCSVCQDQAKFLIQP